MNRNFEARVRGYKFGQFAFDPFYGDYPIRELLDDPYEVEREVGEHYTYLI